MLLIVIFSIFMKKMKMNKIFIKLFFFIKVGKMNEDLYFLAFIELTLVLNIVDLKTEENKT